TFFTLLRTSGAALIAGTLLFTAVGCSEPLSTREQGALLGGVGGAGIGALAGGGKGAAIGGAAGALGGAVVGDQVQRRERERYYYD
ncbi:MAG TPA: YMGG-like glycine zipper-containing protein, partial [Candidatus Binatia bacterium]|nr:YMGG-like glycine zipper-containing protein [Candidatus Binatia bacterium]